MDTQFDTTLTVLMPVYNASLFLKDAIESVLNQSYANFEFIIINDGSTDNSLEIIKSFTDKRITLINNERNLGIIKSRNIGLKRATGKYIANMDADDISLPTRFEKQIDYLEKNPKVAILASKLVLINQYNKEIGYWPEDNSTNTKQDISTTLPIINCIGQPTIMMRSSVVKVFGYKEFKNNEDWGMWLEVLASEYEIDKLPEVLLRYRQHSTSTTVTANKLGVEKKIISFKYHYLKYRITHGVFKRTDKRVLISYLKDCLKYLFKSLSPRLYSVGLTLMKLNKANFVKQYFTARKVFKNSNAPIIWFFPAFHTGGAERVHASILEAVNAKNSITLITSKSDNAVFLDTFSKYTQVIEVYDLLKFDFSKRWLVKQINNQNPKKAFGCNSEFYYKVIPNLNTSIECIDLVHAFVHKHEIGPEKWSIACIDKLSHRIVINQKTKNDFIEFYNENGIEKKYVSNIQLISNFVEANLNVVPKSTDNLKVAFVGRGSEEKRVGLIAKLANKISKQHLNIEFHFIGDVTASIPPEFKSNCILHGVISDEKILSELYNQFHILIIASTREGFPMVIMEAMMHGVVPICTNVGGISEHVIQNKTGFLISSLEENDIITDFETKIIELYSNRNELQKIAEEAHNYALLHFNKEVFNSSYIKLLAVN